MLPMKFRGPFFLSVIAIIFLVAAYYPTTDNAQKEAVLMRTILRGLEQLHYQPQQIDDSFSQKMYDLYLDQIDGGKRFLTQEDVDQLVPYKNQLDDEALKGSYEFFNLSLELLNAGLEKTQGYYQEILDQPFDFSTNETLELDGDKRSFAG